MKFGELWSTN